jgi:hypothetical protein
MLILIVGTKATLPPTLTTPSGWTAPSANQISGGAGSAGADAGANQITVLYREAQAGDTVPTLTLSASPSPGHGIIAAFSKGAAQSWVAPTGATAADTTGSTTTYGTVTGSVTLSLAAGDALCAFTNINGDIGTWADPGGTMAEAGVTFSGQSLLFNDATSTGNDGRMIGTWARFLSGSASAAPTLSISYTSGGSSTSGCSVFLKLSATGTEWPVPVVPPREALNRASFW